MINSLMPQFDTQYIQQTIVRPLAQYEIQQQDRGELFNSIKVASMMVSGFRDILDNLNFDEEKLRQLQFNLDDNYDAVEAVVSSLKDKELKEMTEELLTDMAKLEMEIGDFILEHTHAS